MLTWILSNRVRREKRVVTAFTEKDGIETPPGDDSRLIKDHSEMVRLHSSCHHIHVASKYLNHHQHPAILRACKQAYAEGLPMLYEQNLFCYVTRTESESTVVVRNSLKDKVDKIKHVRDSKGFMQRSKSVSDTAISSN